MVFFLLTFILIYGGLHLYFFIKMEKAVPLRKRQRVGLIVFLVAMLISPIIERIMMHMGFELPACILSYAGYTWMGVIFFFFHLALVFDAYRLVLRAGGFFTGRGLSAWIPSARIAFYIPLITSCIIAAYGYYEAQDIRTEVVTIKSGKIPEQVGKIRIVQISDIHIGVVVGGERLKKMVSEVVKAGPDILVSTGDFIDGQIDGIHGTKALFRNLKPRFGKYAITGNHEFYAGLDQFLKLMSETDFTVLRGEVLTVAGVLNIAGVDDPAGKNAGLSVIVSEKKLLEKLPSRNFTVLLKHKPVLDKDASGLFDLQLSGHTHQGQLFPFRFITMLAFPYNAGLFHLPGEALLYVSRGVGTWGPPMRFMSPPEITIIDLVHEKNNK